MGINLSIDERNIEHDFLRISTDLMNYWKLRGRITQGEITEIVKQYGALNCCTWTIKNV